MPKKAKPLTALTVARLKKPGLHFVGTVDGLALQVTPNGARSWILRFTVGDKRREMGLGSFPTVALAGAHEAAREARAKLRQGIDPIGESKALRSALTAAHAAERTFEQCADAYITAHEPGWRNAKHGQQWRNTLKKYAYPIIGAMLVRDVDTPAVLKVIEPIWQDKTETAVRVQQRINLILDMAIAKKYCPGPNPARWRGYLDKMLAKPSKIMNREHHRSLPVAEVGAFMVKLRTQNGIGAKALEFAILTAARSGEVRGATWKEIDLDAKTWTIPGNRMKAGEEHIVPLSDPAMKILRSIPRIEGVDLVFPAPRGGLLSDMTLSAVLRRMKVDAVVHGFRSSFRVWCSEKTNYSRDVAEMALAHAVGNQVERAYARSVLLEKRRPLMDDWARFCARPAALAGVIPMKRAAK